MSCKVAIVILNWNGKGFLQKYLPSVINYSLGDNTKIVVVDNSSTDGSVQIVRDSYPQVELIVHKKNFGFARGYSRALPQINAEYYVLLNSDVEVTQNWLVPLIELLDSDPSIAAAMPKIRSYVNKDYFEYAGAAGGFIDRYGYPFCQGRIITEVEKDEGQYNQQKEIFWASGACMFLRSSAYAKTGGLDGNFFAHMEEIDLCWRLKKLGYSIFYCPSSLVYHLGGGTLPNDNPQKLYYNYRNNLFLLFKNLERKELVTKLFPRMLLDGASAALYLFQGKFPFFIAVFRAYARFYLSLGMLINKRGIFNKMIGNNQVGHIYNRSIIFDFFFRKKRKFTSLKF